MKTVLIIEDEKDLAELIAFNLEREGYHPLIALDGASGMEAVHSSSPDLILLDLMLPGLPGTEICKILKSSSKTARIPIIMLTAKGDEIDRVVGLEVGADDYMVKPYSTRELLLRIKALLRRMDTGGHEGKVLRFGPVSIDVDRHLVLIEGSEVNLTTTEFNLLLNLAERQGRVQNRDRLLKDVWGLSHIGDTRTVDTHITRLRTKLGESGDMIKTVRGFGYKLEVQ